MPLLDTAWAQGGAVGILALVVLLIVTGRLVPRSVSKALVEQANARADAADRRADLSDQRADLLSEQLTEMVAALRAVEALVRTPAPPRVPS